MRSLRATTAHMPALILGALCTTGLLVSTSSYGDDAPPPADTAPNGQNPSGHRHSEAWAACKKQADDQKITDADARHAFMRNCVKSAKTTAPAPAS